MSIFLKRSLARAAYKKKYAQQHVDESQVKKDIGLFEKMKLMSDQSMTTGTPIKKQIMRRRRRGFQGFNR